MKTNKKKMIIIGASVLVVVITVIVVLTMVLSGKTKENSAVIKDGVIVLDDVSLTFEGDETPSDNNAVLTVKNSKNSEQELSNSIVSSLYTLEVKEATGASVTISLPVPESFSNGELKGDALRIGIGQEFTLSDGTTERLYSYFDTVIEGQVAKATFVPSEHAGISSYMAASGEAVSSQKSGEVFLYIGIFSQNATYIKNTGRFKIWYPCGLKFPEVNREIVLNDLEAMLDMYLNAGYDCGSSFPIEFTLERNISQVGYYDWLFNKLVVRANEFDSEDEFDNKTSSYKTISLPTMHHEFFHFIQDNYVEYISKNLWFCEATASYYEAKLLNNTATQLTAEYYEFQFESVIPTNNDGSNGYARAPLIAYMCKKNGEKWISEIYKNKDDSDAAIEKVMSYISPTFVSDYYLAMGMGDIGTNMAYNHYLNTKNQESKVSKTGAKLELKVPDENEMKETLSQGEAVILDRVQFDLKATGGLFVSIDIPSTELAKIPETALVSVNCDEGVLSLIKIKGREAERVSCDIENFKQSIADGYVYMAVVSSSIKQKISVTVELSTEAPVIFNRVKVSPEYSDKGKGILRYAGYNAGATTVDKQGNFEIRINELVNENVIVNDYILKGKIDFKTLTVAATLSYENTKYIVQSSTCVDEYGNVGLINDGLICDEVYTVSNISGKLLRTSKDNESRDPIIDPNSENKENCYTFYWSSFDLTTYYHAPDITPEYDEEKDEFVDPVTGIVMDGPQIETSWSTNNYVNSGVLSANVSVELCFYWED